MSAFKLLIDTNVFIGLEDPKRVDPALAEVVRKCAEFSIGVFVHEAALADIGRDKDATRREISFSKVRKFQELKALKLPEKAVLEARFGAIRKSNDEVDVALLHALDIKAVDLLITEDLGIHGRVKLTPLASQVLTVADALAWRSRSTGKTRASRSGPGGWTTTIASCRPFRRCLQVGFTWSRRTHPTSVY